MKHCLKTLTITAFGLLLIASCKKDKGTRRVDPDQPKIQVTKAADDNSAWELFIDAADADRAGIWVDLNNNGTKDNGETPTKFGMNLDDKNTFSLGSSKTITIYGKVTKFGCPSNELTGIDISNNTILVELDCAYNRLTTLYVAKNTRLESLDCSYNELPALDVSKNTALKYLSCYWNQLTALNLTQNTGLTHLACFKNKLTALDLTKNTALEQFLCVLNQITTLDLSQNKALKVVDITRNSFNSANMKHFLNTLPTLPSSSKGILYLLYPPDNNSVPANADITTAKSKNWKLYEFHSTGWEEM